MGMGGSTSSRYYTLANMLLAIGGALMLGCGALRGDVAAPVLAVLRVFRTLVAGR
jgi:hypothetical protein